MSSLNKPYVVAIIGSVILIGVIAGFYFLSIQKEMQAYSEQQTIYEANKQYLDPQLLVQAKKKVADAEVQVAQAQAQWDQILRFKNPVIDLSDVFSAWKQLTNELVFYLGPDLEKQLRSTPGVRPTSGVSIGGPPSDPNDVISLMQPGWFSIPVAAGGNGGGASFGGPPGGFGGGGFGGPPGGFGGGGFRGGPPAGFGGGGFRGGPPAGFGGGGGGAGTLKVVGSFPAILKHIKSWNNFNRIAKVTDLSLSGNSPYLTGSYNVTIYEFPRNADKPGKRLPSDAGGAGQGVAGGPAGAPVPAAAGVQGP